MREEHGGYHDILKVVPRTAFCEVLIPCYVKVL